MSAKRKRPTKWSKEQLSDLLGWVELAISSARMLVREAHSTIAHSGTRLELPIEDDLSDETDFAILIPKDDDVGLTHEELKTFRDALLSFRKKLFQAKEEVLDHYQTFKDNAKQLQQSCEIVEKLTYSAIGLLKNLMANKKKDAEASYSNLRIAFFEARAQLRLIAHENEQKATAQRIIELENKNLDNKRIHEHDNLEDGEEQAGTQ